MTIVEKGQYLITSETAVKLADILADAGFTLSVICGSREEMPELVVRQWLGPKSPTTDK